MVGMVARCPSQIGRLSFWCRKNWLPCNPNQGHCIYQHNMDLRHSSPTLECGSGFSQLYTWVGYKPYVVVRAVSLLQDRESFTVVFGLSPCLQAFHVFPYCCSRAHVVVAHNRSNPIASHSQVCYIRGVAIDLACNCTSSGSFCFFDIVLASTAGYMPNH